MFEYFNFLRNLRLFFMFIFGVIEAYMLGEIIKYYWGILVFAFVWKIA